MKTQGWLRALNIVFGLFCVVLSAVVLAYRGLDIPTLILIIATALLVVGLDRIIFGIFAKHISIRLRTINVGAGLLEIGITMTTMVYSQYVARTLIELLSVALLVHGANSAVIGRFVRNLPSLLRGLFVVVGLLSISLSVIVFVSVPLGSLTLVYILSIGYLLNGIIAIILGITGVKPGPILARAFRNEPTV